MDLQPFFDDDPALNQEHLQFDDTTDSDNCREEEEEQEEYDAINDETFGGELNALDESGLEEFANRVCTLNFNGIKIMTYFKLFISNLKLSLYLCIRRNKTFFNIFLYAYGFYLQIGETQKNRKNFY